MKVVLYAAVSVDGYIARSNGDTDWVKDDELFEKTCKDFGCVVMGNNTFEEFGSPPFEGVQYLVLTGKDTVPNLKNTHFVGTAEQAVQKAKELGFDMLLVIGGAQTNASFAKARPLDEIWLDTHTLILGEGKKLLDDFTSGLELEIISSQTQPQGFIHSKFKVKERGEL